MAANKRQQPSSVICKSTPRIPSLTFIAILLALLMLSINNSTMAQIAPTEQEIANYGSLHAAIHRGDAHAVRRYLDTGSDANKRDLSGRTPAHIAAHASAYDTLRVLVKAGADIKALDHQRYDVITIAAVNNDVQMVNLAIELGGNPKAVTSQYDGTALIAAAHLGHVEVVETLITSGAPLNHINNLGWTALIEAIILGDGGTNHTEIVKELIDAGADKSIADRNGNLPIKHARQLGFSEIIDILE